MGQDHQQTWKHEHHDNAEKVSFLRDLDLTSRQHLQSLPRATQKRPPKIPPHIQILNSSSTSEGQRVVIDGVIFQFEQGGTKLARIGGEFLASVAFVTRRITFFAKPGPCNANPKDSSLRRTEIQANESWQPRQIKVKVSRSVCLSDHDQGTHTVQILYQDG